MHSSICVIGTIFVDFKGFAQQNYHPSTRNLGSIQLFHGGVGRNVAETLANLQLNTLFVSTVDDSPFGKEVIERLERSKINIEFLSRAKQMGMGMWLAILDDKGNLAGSISQMPDLTLLKKLITSKGKEAMQQSTHISLELDLSIEIAQDVLKLAKEQKKPVYGVPGNLEVVLNHTGILGDLDCFICNNFEAELLLKQDFTNLNMSEKQNSLMEFVEHSRVGAMVVTLGEKGAVYYDSRTKQAGYQPVFPVKLVDTSGAGDAFFSGTVMGLVKGLPLGEAIICGTKVAGWTIESPENTCTDLPIRIKRDEFFRSIQ